MFLNSECHQPEREKAPEESPLTALSSVQPLGPAYTLNELPQPQVFFTLGLLNLKPAPSTVST
jgi:hypothetical protein